MEREKRTRKEEGVGEGDEVEGVRRITSRLVYSILFPSSHQFFLFLLQHHYHHLVIFIVISAIAMVTLICI